MTVSFAPEYILLDTMAFEGTVQHILETRQITRTDQQRLMKFGMASISTQHTQKLMDQISEALRFGRLRVVD